MSQLPYVGADALTVLYDPTKYQYLAIGDTTVTGSTGYDVLETPASQGLATTGATLTMSGIECLVGGTKEAVILTDPNGCTLLTRGCETLVGSAGVDVIQLGDCGANGDTRGNVFLTRMEETLLGGAGTDIVTIGDTGSTLLVGALETLVGGLGTDVVTLASTGCTMRVSGLETIIGGTGNDVLDLASAGMHLQGVKTLTEHAALHLHNEPLDHIDMRGITQATIYVDAAQAGMFQVMLVGDNILKVDGVPIAVIDNPQVGISSVHFLSPPGTGNLDVSWTYTGSDWL